MHDGFTGSRKVFTGSATVADKAEFAKPHQYAVGFKDVVINGKQVIVGGELTAERPGRVLYGPAKR